MHSFKSKIPELFLEAYKNAIFNRESPWTIEQLFKGYVLSLLHYSPSKKLCMAQAPRKLSNYQITRHNPPRTGHTKYSPLLTTVPIGPSIKLTYKKIEISRINRRRQILLGCKGLDLI